MGVVLKVLEFLTNGNFFMVQILTISSFKNDLFVENWHFFVCFSEFCHGWMFRKLDRKAPF